MPTLHRHGGFPSWEDRLQCIFLTIFIQSVMLFIRALPDYVQDFGAWGMAQREAHILAERVRRPGISDDAWSCGSAWMDPLLRNAVLLGVKH